MSKPSLQIRLEIEETLARLDRTVDEIAAKADVKRHIDETLTVAHDVLDGGGGYETGALLRAFGAGAVTGLRTMTGPATAFRSGTHPQWERVLPALALAELLADKLPFTPSRTSAPQLTARVLTGMITGAGVASARGGNRYAGALAGALGALAASYAGAAYRRVAVERKIPPVIAALIEDAVAIGAGLAITKAPAV